MKQVLIILRGPPASGKTTLGKILRNADKKIVWLQVDGFKRFFSEDSDVTLDEVSKTALVTLSYLLNQGYSVIYDGIFKNPDYVQKAVELAKKKDISSVIYQLKCSLKTLLERDTTREGINEGHRIPMDPKVVESIFNKLEQTPIERAIDLNTENQTLEQCLDIISKSFK